MTPEPNRRRPYAKLVISGSRPYQLTHADVLWLARSAVYEGGNPEDVLWTLGQRFIGRYRSTFGTLGAFLQSFSQPIMKSWRRGGEACLPGGIGYETAACSERALNKREVASTADWLRLWKKNPHAVETTILWANGQIPNPLPRSTNFAAETVAPGYLKRVEGSKLLAQRDNWYIQEPWAADWPDNHVTLQSYDGAVANADEVRYPSLMRQVFAVWTSAVINPLRV